MAREFQQVDCTVDVCFGVELGLAQRRSHARARRKMHDAIKAVRVEKFTQCGAIANVDLGERVTRVLEMFSDICSFDFRFVEVVEIVNDSDEIDVAAKQSIDEMRTDEPCTASYEKIFHHSFVALFVA